MTNNNITSNCTVNGEKVDCAEMVKTAKSWFKAGLWSLLIFGIIFIVGGIFWLIMLIHAISNPIPNKVLWILIIFFLSFLGAVIYYFVIKRNYIPTVIPSGIDPINSLNMGIAPTPVAPTPVAPAPVAPAPVAPGNTMNPPLAK